MPGSTQTSAIYWGSAASGSFADTARWADGLAPGAAHIAVFKTVGTFTAALAADTANKRLRVRTGTVTLDLAGHTYTLAATAAERSILVGQVSGDSASLTFTGGTVTAVDASLGEASGATGSLRLTGAGTSLVLSGSLGVGGSPTAAGGSGTLTVESGTSLQVGGNVKVWGGTFDLAGSLTAPGFDLSGGTISGSSPVTVGGVSTWTGGTMSGSGTTTIAANGALTISGASSKTLGNRTLTNSGSIIHTGTGSLVGGSGSPAAILNNQALAVYDLQGNTNISGSPGTFNNAGLLKKSGGGSSTISWIFNNTGTVEVQTGTYLYLDRDVTSSGTFSVAPGATLDFSGGFSGTTYAISNPAGLPASGLKFSSSGALSISGDKTFDALTWTGGTMTGTGTTTIAANGTLTLSAASDLTLFNRTITNYGLTIDATDATLSGNALLGVFNNAGVFRKMTGMGLQAVSWQFNNTGSVEVLSGELRLFRGSSSSGSFVVSPGALINFSNGTHTISNPAGLPLSGVKVSAGEFSVSGDVTFHSLQWTGGTLTGAGTTFIDLGGSLVIGFVTTGSSQALVGRALRTSGTTTWASNNTDNIGFANGAVFENTPAAVFDAQNNQGLNQGTGAMSRFDNAGIFSKSLGTGTTTVAILFNNTGTVDVQKGMLSLNAGGTSTGVFSTSTVATLRFGGGAHDLNAGASLTGTGLAQVTAGTVNFASDVNLTGSGALTVSGGTLNFNTGATVTNLTGGFNLTGGTLGGTGNMTLSTMNWSGGSMSGSGSTTIAALGTLTMSGAPIKTVTGRALIVNGSVLFQTGAGGLSSTGALTVSGAAAVLDLGASHSATAATVTVDGGGSITGTGTSGVTATASFAMKTGAVGAILRGTGIPLNKTTAGTVTLSGANTYTGATAIQQGTLSAATVAVSAGASALGNAASAVVLGDATNKGTLAYTGGTATYTRGFTLAAGGGEVDVTTAGQTLTVATGAITSATNGSLTLGGAGHTIITSALALGTGTVTKTGGGTLTINGMQTYATLTTSGGITNVNSRMGTGTSVVLANATINFSVSQTLASLSIGDGVEVTFGNGLALAPWDGDGGKIADAPALVLEEDIAGMNASPGIVGFDLSGESAPVVPEPGALCSLLCGAGMLLGVRRSRAKPRRTTSSS